MRNHSTKDILIRKNIIKAFRKNSWIVTSTPTGGGKVVKIVMKRRRIVPDIILKKIIRIKVVHFKPNVFEKVSCENRNKPENNRLIIRFIF